MGTLIPEGSILIQAVVFQVGESRNWRNALFQGSPKEQGGRVSTPWVATISLLSCGLVVSHFPICPPIRGWKTRQACVPINSLELPLRLAQHSEAFRARRQSWALYFGSGRPSTKQSQEIPILWVVGGWSTKGQAILAVRLGKIRRRAGVLLTFYPQILMP